MKRFTCLAALVGFFVLGCEPSIPRPPASQRPTSAPALPPSPSLEVRPYRKLLDDGSYTVEGLLRDRERVMGEDVTVTGVVASVVKCAPAPVAAQLEAKSTSRSGEPAPAPAPVVPATCNPPQHLVLVDPDAGPEPKWSLTVYGTMKSALARQTQGETTTLTGDFAMSSPDGVFLRQGGMLILPDDGVP